MSIDPRELYQEVILDHNHHARNRSRFYKRKIGVIAA